LENKITYEEIAKTFAEAILENHKDGNETNVEVWRQGIVILAEQYLKLIDYIESE